jgi:hypothetical protein
MLAFLIPVKHPARARSYALVTELLRSTLTSIAQQTVRPIGIYVVCNQLPSWAGEMKEVIFIDVDFPPARAPTHEGDVYEWIYRDKGSKIAVALERARRDGATHVMVVDADDFVSRRLAEHVSAHPQIPGWYFPDGLFYSRLFKIAEVREEFWSRCGSSHIVRADLLPDTPNWGARPKQEEVVQCFEPWILDHILGDHVQWRRHFAERGHALQPLPFPGAVWQTDTGDNSSRAWFGQTRFGPVWGRPVGSEQAAEFSIPLERRGLGPSVLLHGWRLRSLVGRAVKR